MNGVSASDRHEAVPPVESEWGVLVLAGSSGRIEERRADLLAQHGIRAHANRWFGGIGQRPVPHEVPLELFLAELDRLRASCDRVAILGTSFGAEAALVTASLAPLDATIAIAPTWVVWPGLFEGSWSSHWTLAGAPLHWVPFDADWVADADPPEYVGLYTGSAERSTDEAAVIPVERIAGELLLVAGGDDRVWPGTDAAARIIARREAAGLATALVQHPDAGHRIPFPGEPAANGGTRMARGGTPDADAALGAAAFDAMLRMLGVEHGRMDR